jgi:hypothetical protein
MSGDVAIQPLNLLRRRQGRALAEVRASLVRLLRDNRQGVIDAFLKAETVPDRWRRLLAEKIDTIVKMRGLSRLDAEADAFRHVVIDYLNETHPKTDPRVCAHCRGPDLPLTLTCRWGRRSSYVAAQRLLGAVARAASRQGRRRACPPGRCEAMTGRKIRESERWRGRRKPPEPSLKPLAVALAPSPPSIPVPEPLTAADRARIARWVASRIVSWPPDNSSTASGRSLRREVGRACQRR